MIEVFPAPVAPTIATLSPALIVKSTSRRTQSPSLYANETLRKPISPRTCGSSIGCSGSWMFERVSRSRKTRSEEAIAACMMLYFSDRSRIGWKNWFSSCQNATSVPSVRFPPTTQFAPTTNSAAAVALRVKLTAGWNTLIARTCPRFAVRRSRLSASNASNVCFSRVKSCTIAIPDSVSFR